MKSLKLFPVFVFSSLFSVGALAESGTFMEFDLATPLFGDSGVTLKAGKYFADHSYAWAAIGEHIDGNLFTDHCDSTAYSHFALGYGLKYQPFDNKFFLKGELGASYGTKTSYLQCDPDIKEKGNNIGVQGGIYTGFDLGRFSLSGGIKSMDFQGDDPDLLLIQPLVVQWRF